MSDRIERVCQNNVGTVFELTITEWDYVTQEYVSVNVSTATLKQIKFHKPDGTTVTKTAAFKTDGSQGTIIYTTIANDLDDLGAWRHRAYIEMPGFTGHSDDKPFEVVRID